MEAEKAGLGSPPYTIHTTTFWQSISPSPPPCPTITSLYTTIPIASLIGSSQPWCVPRGPPLTLTGHVRRDLFLLDVYPPLPKQAHAFLDGIDCVAGDSEHDEEYDDDYCDDEVALHGEGG